MLATLTIRHQDAKRFHAFTIWIVHLINFATDLRILVMTFANLLLAATMLSVLLKTTKLRVNVHLVLEEILYQKLNACQLNYAIPTLVIQQLFARELPLVIFANVHRVLLAILKHLDADPKETVRRETLTVHLSQYVWATSVLTLVKVSAGQMLFAQSSTGNLFVLVLRDLKQLLADQLSDVLDPHLLVLQTLIALVTFASMDSAKVLSRLYLNEFIVFKIRNSHLKKFCSRLQKHS